MGRWIQRTQSRGKNLICVCEFFKAVSAPPGPNLRNNDYLPVHVYQSAYLYGSDAPTAAPAADRTEGYVH